MGSDIKEVLTQTGQKKHLATNSWITLCGQDVGFRRAEEHIQTFGEKAWADRETCKSCTSIKEKR